MRRLRLVQLPVPQPAAYAATGNVPLAARADPEAVTFAGHRLERAWQRRVLGYGEVAAPGDP
jgi:hypothetical protein